MLWCSFSNIPGKLEYPTMYYFENIRFWLSIFGNSRPKLHCGNVINLPFLCRQIEIERTADKASNRCNWHCAALRRRPYHLSQQLVSGGQACSWCFLVIITRGEASAISIIRPSWFLFLLYIIIPCLLERQVNLNVFKNKFILIWTCILSFTPLSYFYYCMLLLNYNNLPLSSQNWLHYKNKIRGFRWPGYG